MFRLIFSYFVWHYSQAFRDIYNLFKNFVWFVYHFFSIKILLKTLLSPWRKLTEPYKGGWDLGALFETFVVNTIMRAVGVLVRISIILVGLISIVVVCLAGLLSIVVWMCMPFIIMLLFVSSLRLLI